MHTFIGIDAALLASLQNIVERTIKLKPCFGHQCCKNVHFSFIKYTYGKYVYEGSAPRHDAKLVKYIQPTLKMPMRMTSNQTLHRPKQ